MNRDKQMQRERQFLTHSPKNIKIVIIFTQCPRSKYPNKIKV